MTEQKVFAESVVEHLPFLNRMVYRLMRGDAMAEDVVQQTVLKALIHAGQFRLESSVRTWLMSIAMNEVRSVYRSKWHTRTVPLVTDAVDRRQSYQPRDICEEKERETLVREAVKRLPPGYRSVLELCDFQHATAREAALRLGITATAVKIRRYRARLRLQSLIGKPQK